ncbi:hypothetical protein PTSG_03865 [Salpingoeca rosetta]|uniref:Major facilitator superfamily (MFS) profile domain-containing protein n=1 Tax=Salpingoeca rosetta (strain ATCC 50818 / BSB-021) TaxID=946362 RepID=F2U5L7_SALR5|nr:uncharacterized protein PTSG_03865 [Salpingoeca rosetta]EGD83233.1 hypothetical protein PTSG_03865 [Salpingoeca rosetta]|eukprot:XP_004995597.1 hypothetical protein PTSG_03865 [Salpingoeca rosetta]
MTTNATAASASSSSGGGASGGGSGGSRRRHHMYEDDGGGGGADSAHTRLLLVQDETHYRRHAHPASDTDDGGGSGSGSSGAGDTGAAAVAAAAALRGCPTTLRGVRLRLKRLMATSDLARAVIPSVAIIIAYWCVYLFRYPVYLLENDDFSQPTMAGLGVKTWMSTASVLAMAVSKFPAIRVLSALKPAHRFRFLIATFVLGGLGFTAFLPLDMPVLATLGMFAAGFPTGCIYTALLAYLEGRQNTELYISALNMVVVFGSSAARAVARALLGVVAPLLMPLLIVLLATPVFVVCTYVLDCIPPPSLKDQQSQSVRKPMPAPERNHFLKSFWPGLVCINIAYMAAVALRSYRDFFANDIYTPLLGRSPQPQDYLAADIPGGIVSTILLLLLVRIRNNRRAFKLCLSLLAVGGCIAMLAVVAYVRSALTGYSLIILIGCATFVSIVPFSGSLYDRLLAATHTDGTSVFLVLISDCFGYVGAIAVLLYRPFSSASADYDGFFIKACAVAGLACVAAGFAASVYFSRRLHSDSYRPLRRHDDDDDDDDDDNAVTVTAAAAAAARESDDHDGHATMVESRV